MAVPKRKTTAEQARHAPRQPRQGDPRAARQVRALRRGRPPHRACGACGFYKGRKVKATKAATAPPRAAHRRARRASQAPTSRRSPRVTAMTYAVVPRSRILGTGHYTPERVVSNAELEKVVDTTDAWIAEHTGIRRRHVAADNEVTSDMAAAAGRRALEAAGLNVADLDMIIVGTISGDTPMPACAVHVQQKLGADEIPAFDVSAACAGFLYGLTIADQFIATGKAALHPGHRRRAALPPPQLAGPHHLRPLRRRRRRGGARPGQGRRPGHPLHQDPHRRLPRGRLQHPRRRLGRAAHGRRARAQAQQGPHDAARRSSGSPSRT